MENLNCVALQVHRRPTATDREWREGGIERERAREEKAFTSRRRGLSKLLIARRHSRESRETHTHARAHTGAARRGKRPFFDDVHAFGGIHDPLPFLPQLTKSDGNPLLSPVFSKTIWA